MLTQPRTAARVPLLRVVAGCAALAAASLLVHSTPTYDPWTWLTWGREILGLELDTSEGPAVKPLPMAITTLLAPLGDAAPWLWLLVARTATLAAVAMAWRLGRRLAGGSVAAGTLAAGGLLLTDGFVWHGTVGNAEGLLLALVLIAAERALDGHHRQAFALGLAAALVRTEAVPFLALYGLWLWRGDRGARPLIAASALALPVLWLGPDLVAAGDALRSSERAKIPNPGAPALAEVPSLESLSRAIPLAPVPVLAGAALALLAVARRELPRLVLLAIAAGTAWVALIAAMSELGYSGEERYAMPGAALLAIGAGAGVAWAAGRVPALARRHAAVAAVIALALAGEAAPMLAADARGLDRHARIYGSVDEAVAAAGGRAAVAGCAPVHTAPYSRPALAWQLELPLSAISTETARDGIVFQARTVAGAPPGPALDGTFRGVARAGEWRVLERCRGGGLR